jgi:5'-3' exoribonuclease 1
MVVHIQNPHENSKTEDVAKKIIGQRMFMNWPFLQEGQVAAVSDSLFKYEMMVVTPGAPARVISNPHAPQGLGYWKMKSERIEHYYSKRCGVITGNIDILLHIRPLKGTCSALPLSLMTMLIFGCLGLKRLESGAFVKDYEGADKEVEQAVQMCLSEVASEDSRYLEREAPPLSEDFPDGSKIFFLGEHAYGVAAQVSATTNTTLSVILAVRMISGGPIARLRRR